MHGTDCVFENTYNPKETRKKKSVWTVISDLDGPGLLSFCCSHCNLVAVAVHLFGPVEPQPMDASEVSGKSKTNLSEWTAVQIIDIKGECIILVLL